MEVDTVAKEKIRVTSYGGPGNLSMTGLSPEEIEQMRGAMFGLSWVRVDQNGRLETMTAIQAVKGPAEDETMLPFWRPVNLGDAKYEMQLELFDKERLGPSWSPHIAIQSLCGYDYTPERYAQEAEKLTRFGFECLRSRRSRDGHYWEIWYLSGLWAAKAELKQAIEWKEEIEKDTFGFPEFGAEPKYTPIPDEQKLPAAIEFLRGNCSFGSCDVSVQRLAMVMD